MQETGIKITFSPSKLKINVQSCSFAAQLIQFKRDANSLNYSKCSRGMLFVYHVCLITDQWTNAQ